MYAKGGNSNKQRPCNPNESGGIHSREKKTKRNIGLLATARLLFWCHSGAAAAAATHSVSTKRSPLNYHCLSVELVNNNEQQKEEGSLPPIITASRIRESANHLQIKNKKCRPPFSPVSSMYFLRLCVFRVSSLVFVRSGLPGGKGSAFQYSPANTKYIMQRNSFPV